MWWILLTAAIAVNPLLLACAYGDEQEIDIPDGEYVIGELNGGTNITLAGKCKSLIVGLVDGASTLDASALEAEEIIFHDKVDGKSIVKLSAANGNVEFRKKVDGQSTVEVNAPGGTVVFSDAGGFLNEGSKIDGHSRLRIKAKEVDFRAKIDGGRDTHVVVTLTENGALRASEINGECRLHYRKADPSDPEPSVQVIKIDGGAELKRLD